VNPEGPASPQRSLAPAGQAAEIAAFLVQRRETVCVAETAAGGLISAALVAIPGASAWFLGSAVAYGGLAKARWLGLEADSFAPDGVVSPSGAMALARAVRDSLGATWDPAEVGSAGPQTERRSRKGAGLAYVAVSGPQEVWREVLTGEGQRVTNQSAFALAALQLLREALAC
jgi:nicotinamide-nucleotide amidase